MKLQKMNHGPGLVFKYIHICNIFLQVFTNFRNAAVKRMVLNGNWRSQYIVIRTCGSVQPRHSQGQIKKIMLEECRNNVGGKYFI